MTYPQLGKALDVKPDTLRNYLAPNARTPISLEMAYRIADVAKVPRAFIDVGFEALEDGRVVPGTTSRGEGGVRLPGPPGDAADRRLREDERPSSEDHPEEGTG